MDKSLRHERILDCRYYNGEDSAPEGINQLFWGYECGWVNSLDQNNGENWKYEEKVLKRLGLENFEPDDGTPYSFKCLLFNRYCHWIGVYNGGDDFLRWYKEEYQQPRKTNRQRRYDERKVNLIKKCRFYNGEEECPFNNAKDEHFWKYENIWVDMLSNSYSNADEWRKELAPYKEIQAIVKEYGLPSSYIGLLINRDMHWLGMIDEKIFIRSLLMRLPEI